MLPVRLPSRCSSTAAACSASSTTTQSDALPKASVCNFSGSARNCAAAHGQERVWRNDARAHPAALPPVTTRAPGALQGRDALAEVAGHAGGEQRTTGAASNFSFTAAMNASVAGSREEQRRCPASCTSVRMPRGCSRRILPAIFAPALGERAGQDYDRVEARHLEVCRLPGRHRPRLSIFRPAARLPVNPSAAMRRSATRRKPSSLPMW